MCFPKETVAHDRPWFEQRSRNGSPGEIEAAGRRVWREVADLRLRWLAILL